MRYLKLLLALSLLLIQSVVALDTPDTEIQIPLRDGSSLPADVYLPNSEARQLPCILVRSPAGRKQEYFQPFVNMKHKGYAVIIQETRNVGDPEGKTMPYIPDGWGAQQDGYDTVEFLAQSEWTNGNIGTVGTSAMGITQLLMAPSAPPSLKCQHIGMAAASLYHHASYGGGQYHKNVVEGWLGQHAPHPSILELVVVQPEYNDFWKQFDSVKFAENVRAPGLFMAGWYDLFLQGTIDGFVARQQEGGEGAKFKQKLVIGPWTHFWPMEQRLGDYTVPMLGNQPPLVASLEAWFDHHLKENVDGVDESPAVSYYVMGPFDGSASKGNVWKTSDTWPVPHTPKAFFLNNEGKLDIHWPKELAETSFRYDPNHPSPTIGGRNLFLESGPKDQASIESREDVVTFTSEDLSEDTEVTGQIKAKIFVSSDVDETDIAIRLCDVYPDGKSVLIAEGLTRVKDLKPEEGEFKCPQEVEVDLMSTSIVFAKGHQIRVSVTGSNYPCYDKNLNVKRNTVNDNVGEGIIADTTIHSGRYFPSRLILPIVES